MLNNSGKVLLAYLRNKDFPDFLVEVMTKYERLLIRSEIGKGIARGLRQTYLSTFAGACRLPWYVKTSTSKQVFSLLGIYVENDEL